MEKRTTSRAATPVAGAAVPSSPEPGPVKAPKLTVLHALAAGADFQRYFHWRRSRDGDPFLVRFPGFDPVLFTGTPEGAGEIFRAPPELLEPPQPNPIEPMVGAASLILAAGERHRRDRALLAPAFHGNRIRGFGALIHASVLAEMAEWQPGNRINAQTVARAITLRVILDAVVGVHEHDRRAEYTTAITEFLTAFSGPLLLVPALRRGLLGRAPWDRFVAARARLDRLILAEIGRRRDRPPLADILGVLLTTRYDDGSAPSDKELCEQLRTLLVAGHETTATTLVWALYRLHRNPLVLRRLRAELRSAGADATPDELAALPYLNAVCQEVLRLHPPVPMVLRRVLEPFELRGVRLAAGQVMGLALPLLHSDPAVWTDPEQFCPERFRERRYRPFEFAPYGGGHRRCVGASLADYELRITLATLLSGVRLRLEPRYRRRTPVSGPHNIAAGPLRPIRFEVLT